MDDELRTAISRLKTLFTERDSAEWWSQNIIDASRDITKKENWTLFYAYMHNPEAFDPTRKYETIEDSPEEVDLSYPEGLEAVEYKNGTETTIHVRRVLVDENDDEKQRD